MNLNIYKVDLDTDQPNGGKGESPRSAFTKYNNSLDTISGELTTLGAATTNALSNKADKTITISAGTGLSGGGNLTANRTLSVKYGTTSGTVAAGDDSRIVNAVQTAGTGLSKSGTTLSVNYGTTSTTAARGDDTRITGAVQKSANLSDLSSASAARQNLGLGTAATRDVTTSNADVTSGRLLKVGDLGTNKRNAEVLDFNDLPDLYPYSGSVPVMSNIGSTNKPPKDHYYYVDQHHFTNSANVTQIAIPYRVDNDGMWIRSRYSDTWSTWREIYHTGNTTVDGNGFIKRASPIVKLFSDSIEKTDHLEIEEVELERVGVGHYVLRNVPLLSRDGWYIETPKDRNNNIYIYLDYEEDEDNNTLTIKTYEPDYSTGRAEAGDPVDILEGRFVSLRFEEDESLYVEQEIGNDVD